jgi:hypothetical protein
MTWKQKYNSCIPSKEDPGKSEHLLQRGFNSMGHPGEPPFRAYHSLPSLQCLCWQTLLYTRLYRRLGLYWALIEMGPFKIDASFNGNAINLGMHSLIPRHSII